MRTPLTSILGYLELIERENVTVEGWEDLEVVRRKARFLQRLVSQFYDLSRISGGDYPLQMEDVDIGRIVRETAADHYQELAAGGRQVEIEIPDKPVPAYADKDALTRIIANLLENMAKYGESSLRIRLEEMEQKISILFENDVEAWEEDSAERVFERFYVNDSSRSQGSTGLGLTIARSLAERMGGSLSAGLRTEGEVKWLQMRMEF